MISSCAVRALFLGLVATVAFGGAARAGPLGACLWSRLSPAEHTRVLAAYAKDMGAGATALETLAGKLKAQAAICAKRRDIPAGWVQTVAGAEAVQTYAAAALMATRRLDRPALDAAWAAAPPNVSACVRATARVAYFPNGIGCVDPAASAWFLKRLGLAPNQQPAARPVLYYVNAKAIGEWGDILVAQLAPRRPG